MTNQPAGRGKKQLGSAARVFVDTSKEDEREAQEALATHAQ